ncbi:MAG: amidohydrolase family protein [Alphaproteobacteria bacterium]
MYDLIIRGGQLADGSGGPIRSADVAVLGDRIAAIGRIAETARHEIDAAGLVLSPGLIDVHTHYDAQLTWDPTCAPSPALGVTTVVIGNCGFGIAPNTPSVRDALLRNLSEVEGMPLSALQAGVDWQFESFPEYLDMLRRRGMVPNVAAFFCHSSLRGTVMGPDASRRAATADELAQMRRLLAEALEAGAIGFASSTFENHNGHGGLPMPSRLADDAEFDALIGVLGERRQGLFMATVGQRTTVDTLADWARRTGRPMIYAALLHNAALPERTRNVLAGCRRAREQGLEVYAQCSCQPLSMDFTLDNAYPLYGVDPWGKLPLDDRATIARAFADPEFRDAIRRSLSAPVGGRLFNGDWTRVEIAESPRRPADEGRTVAELARAEGRDPVDLFFDLALSDDLRTVFNAKMLNVDEAGVAEMLRHPDSLVSLSDAGAHLTFLCDAGYGLYLLGHWVRERGVLDLGAAVHALTAKPASIYGIRDRGRIVEGAYADLMLFDPQSVGVGKARRVADLPGGASRLDRQPLGVHGVWVNGAQVHDGTGYVANARHPGRLLTDFADRP